MRLRLTTTFMLVMLAFTARAEQSPPREIWSQATTAVREGDLDTATKKTSELIETGHAYGVRRYPLYASAAASFARAEEKESLREPADWALKATNQLDATSPAVSFSLADREVARDNWGRTFPILATGFTRLLSNVRASLLSRADLLVVASMAIALTAIVFALSLFLRYARAMAHDFREMLSTRFRGGVISVLAFALMFLPLFLWLGPVWLIFYWFIIFFGYAAKRERVMIVVSLIFIAALPLLVERSASWAAIVDSPVVMSAISSQEQSYQPEALRRLQELATIVPDNPTVHVLLGNMFVFEGNDSQAAEHYRRAIQISDAAGAHVNLGNLHFQQNDYTAAITEYERAEKRDPEMAIAFYNNSVASGETYRFDEQGQKLEQAKKIDREFIERLSQSPPRQKIAMFHPEISDAWRVSSEIARRGTARSLFANYAWFDPLGSSLNPITVGALAALALAIVLWLRRRRSGYAGACIKCGRTFCYRCKSARESATYCTQCIHIYLKRDGVALATKRSKLDEVSEHHTSFQRRNRLFATFLPGSAQMLEGRITTGIIGVFLFSYAVAMAVFVGRLAPALGPVAASAQLAVRATAILAAVIIWFLLSLPVYRRRAVG